MNITIKTNLTGTNKNKCRNLAALALVGVVGMLGMANTARAETVYKTSFEQPIFLPGNQLLGTDGWSTAIPPFLNLTAATITDAVAKSGKQSVEVRGDALIGSEGITAPYDAVGSYRHPVDFTVTPANTFARVDADLRIATSKPKTNGEFFSQTISTRSGAGETLGEIGLSSAGKVEAWDFGAVPGSAPKFTTTIRLNKWYHITMLHNFVRHTTTYYIDEHRLGRISTPSASGILLRSSMGVFARPDNTAPDLGSFRANYSARFDNFRISVHKDAPEVD